MAVARAASTPATASNAAAVASFTANAPTGVANGEYTLLIVNIQVASGTVTTPTGWTQLIDTGLLGSGIRTYIFGRTWSTGDPTSWTVSFPTSAPFGAITAGYTGVDTATPLGTPVNTATSSASLTLNVGSMTTTVANSMGLIVCGIGSNSTTFTATPAGYSEWANIGGKRVDLCDLAYPSSGSSTGTKTYTASATTQAWTINAEERATGSGGVTVKQLAALGVG